LGLVTWYAAGRLAPAKGTFGLLQSKENSAAPREGRLHNTVLESARKIKAPGVNQPVNGFTAA